MITTLANNFMLFVTRRYITSNYGMNFSIEFCSLSKKYLKEMIPQIPDIGDSIFKTSYLVAPCYISWFKACQDLKDDVAFSNKMIWDLNEYIIKKVPRFLIPFIRKIYLGTIMKKAESHSRKSKNNTVSKYDWKTRYTKIDKNTFNIDIYECGIKKLCDKFDTNEMLPSICRMDYLLSHYLRHGFKRTKTLGDCNDCCNNIFCTHGSCEWSPEKGFENRK